MNVAIGVYESAKAQHTKKPISPHSTQDQLRLQMHSGPAYQPSAETSLRVKMLLPNSACMVCRKRGCPAEVALAAWAAWWAFPGACRIQCMPDSGPQQRRSSLKSSSCPCVLKNPLSG